MSDASVSRSVRVTLAGLSGQLKWLPVLVARVVLGLLFVSTGWGKLHDLAKVARFFGELHIPRPDFFAGLVAWSELVCGGLLLVGFLSRLATIPLMVTMVVAILTAKHAEVHNVFDLIGQIELTYACLLLVILVIGPGAVSIDGVIAGAIDHRRPTWQEQHPAYGR